MSDVNRLEEECKWIENELFNPSSVEHSIWSSSSPKRDLITRWAENLETLHYAGAFHQDINSISSFISKKFSDAGMESAVHYVRHSLDFKYKRPYDNIEVDINGSDDRLDSSNLLAFEAKQSNQVLISYLTRTITALKSNIERLKKDIFLESKIPEKELELIYLNWEHVLKRHQEAWDGREKVLSKLQHLMAVALSNYSLNYAYTQYVKYAKEDTKLTEKQASKMARLQINKVDKLFDPRSFVEAKELGFIGKQCNKCGSWRTEIRWNSDKSSDMVYCFNVHDDREKDQWNELKIMKLQEVRIR